MSDFSNMHQAAALMNQQVWCWGRDVECSTGNKLVEYGFQRIEKPAGSTGASLYELNLTSTSRVVLRGFGVFYGDERWGGLFLHRFDFLSQFTHEAELAQRPWSLRDLPRRVSLEADACTMLLLGLIHWVGQYELWIAAEAGEAYRQDTVEQWNTRRYARTPAAELPAAWQRLGEAVSQQPETFIPASSSPVSRTLKQSAAAG